MGPSLYDLAQPLLFSLPPETAHETTLRGLHAVQDTPVESLFRRRLAVDDGRLGVEAFGQSFPSPVGIAAGLDKNAHVAPALAALGFGHVEDAGADPLLVKLSPDLGEGAIEDAIHVVNDLNLDGIVATNTTTRRPASLQSPNATEGGGLSGAPIERHATETVRFVARRTDVPVVGVGGVASAEGAYAKIRAGARVVQLYTGLVYEGPTLARDINRGLLELLDRDGFDSVADAVGADL